MPPSSLLSVEKKKRGGGQPAFLHSCPHLLLVFADLGVDASNVVGEVRRNEGLVPLGHGNVVSANTTEARKCE